MLDSWERYEMIVNRPPAGSKLGHQRNRNVSHELLVAEDLDRIIDELYGSEEDSHRSLENQPSRVF